MSGHCLQATIQDLQYSIQSPTIVKPLSPIFSLLIPLFHTISWINVIPLKIINKSCYFTLPYILIQLPWAQMLFPNSSWYPLSNHLCIPPSPNLRLRSSPGSFSWTPKLGEVTNFYSSVLPWCCEQNNSHNFNPPKSLTLPYIASYLINMVKDFEIWGFKIIIQDYQINPI